MRISEEGVFYSIQGEGLNQNTPTTFIRLQGCNLKPPCTYCLVSGKVWFSGGSNFGIREVVPGDKLLAWDGTSIVETTVVEKLSRWVDSYLKISFLGEGLQTRTHELRVTPEHPFMTSKGWKKASEIAVGDELYYLTSSKAQSVRMELNNPMSNPQTMSKKVQSTDYEEISRQLVGDRGGVSIPRQWELEGYPSASKYLSTRMKKDNPMYNPATVEKVARQLSGRTVEFSEEHIEAISKAKSENPTRLFGPDNPNWKGGISQVGRWVFSGEQEVVYEILVQRDGEICQEIDCEATTDLVVHHKDYDILNSLDENLVLLCRGHNSSVGHGRYPLKLKSGEICPVPEVENGLPVVEIREVTRLTQVYNLRCEPYNNFFINGILCHNCDTLHSWDLTKGEEVSVLETLDRVVKAEPRTYRHWVCITGGEPLLQEEELHSLVKGLKKYGFRVEIETNGSLPKPSWYTLADAWSIDYKCPSSSHENSFREEWWDTRSFDMVKFVVENMTDLNFARKLIMRNMVESPTVILSPVIRLQKNGNQDWDYGSKDNLWLQTIWETCKELKVRFNLQQHKIVFGNKKGV